MSTVDRVSQWSHRIFNTSLTETKVSRDSNPFSQSNFQKNILMEDVFESSTKPKTLGFTGSGISQGTKRIYSTFVGSINDFGNKFYEGIKEFGLRIKSGIVSAWNKVSELANTEVHIGEGLKQGYNDIKSVLNYDMGSIINTRGREISKMSKMDPHTQIKPMFSDAVKALEADLVQAA